NDGGHQVARALSPDGTTFGNPEPVLVDQELADPVLWRGVDALASPFVQLAQAQDSTTSVRLWVSARGVESRDPLKFGQAQPTPPDWSIGEAASLDGAHFTPWPFNPVFDRVLDFTNHPSELDPAVLDLGNEWRLYYRRAAA